MIAEHTLEQLEIRPKEIKVSLSVVIIITYLRLGYNRNQIAKICGLHHSAVYDYCERHWNEIAPMLDTTGTYHATLAEYTAVKSKENLLGVLTKPEYAWEQKHVIPLTASSDQHTKQARLLQEKATSITSVDTASINIKEAQADITKMQAELDRLEGV